MFRGNLEVVKKYYKDSIVRRFSAMTAIVCVTHRMSDSPQRVCDPEPHRGERRRRAREQSHRSHERDADRDVAPGKREDGQQPSGRVALLHEHPRHCQTEPATDEHDQEGFSEDQCEDRAASEAERLQNRQLARPLAH